MVTVAIIGGRLQGTEAAYLARKAGFRTLLVDKNGDVPARGLCDEFIQADVRGNADGMGEALAAADLILPATENPQALHALKLYSRLAFDFNAYAITSSKARSDALFYEHGIPAPRYYPYAPGPYIAKPSGGSGSHGVRYIDNPAEAKRLSAAGGWIVQEYLTGPAFSMEVIGQPGSYRTYQATEIHVDDEYDCRLVTCPTGLSEGILSEFSRISIGLAELLRLRGIMDVEAVLCGGLKVLEIDARLPSQTPTAVYRSTGINFLEELYRLFRGDWVPGSGPEVLENELCTAYEHAAVSAEGIRETGERLMSRCSPLALYELGGTEVITDYSGGGCLRATIINSSNSPESLAGLRERSRKALAGVLLRRQLNTSLFLPP